MKRKLKRARCPKKIDTFSRSGNYYARFYPETSNEDRVLLDLIETYESVGDTINFVHLRYYIKNDEQHCDIKHTSCLKSVFVGNYITKDTMRIDNGDYMSLYSKAANLFIDSHNYLHYKNLPLYAIIVKIDRRLIEAAEDLGCPPVKVFSKVILPLSMPGILSGITMVFVPAVSTFYISQKLGGTDTMLIGDVIERQFKSAGNPNLGAALSLVLMILVFVCTGIMNRFGADEEGGVIA